MDQLTLIQQETPKVEGATEMLNEIKQTKLRTLSFKTDQEYLDGYFNICKLYQEKRVVLKKIDQANDLTMNPQRRYFDPSVIKPLKRVYRKKEDKMESLQRKVLIMNGKIKNLENLFWKIVEEAKQEGVKFAFEDMALSFKLQPFEKRILLYFYYLEYHSINQNLCKEDELLFLFDLDNSVLSRMINFKYFTSEATLFDTSLLVTDSLKSIESARLEIALTNKALKVLSEALNGEKPELVEQKTGSLSNDEKVGYVKEPEYSMDDVLLKEDVKDKIKLFLDSFKDNKLEALGIKEKIKKGLGTTFLFYGPSGTGKSMLAEAIGKYVNKKILMVDYSKIMEKWVGATDKNISSIFRLAKKDDLVILLDEADTLFYSRSFATQEHDIRFVNEMLMELERFQGMVILTSNMDALLDQALERRVSLKIKFELPSKETRLGIWQSHLPKQLKLTEDVDFSLLANKYDFSGGNIKNAVLNALRKMISRNSEILSMDDLLFGANTEKDGMYGSKPKNPIGFITH